MPPEHPNARTFVVQLGGAADPDQDRLVGRVEHLDSGRRARFASGEELNEFIARVLREVEETGTTDGTGDPERNH